MIESWICQNCKKGVFGFAQSAPRVEAGNAGLWFDRFGSTWAVNREQRPGKPPKYALGPSTLAWAASLWSAPPRLVGALGELRDYSARLKKLARGMGGDCLELDIAPLSRFVTGVGIPHPIENGFAWHRTLGVPYLPGSGVKGLVRAWACDWQGIDPDEQMRLFGKAPKGPTDTGANLGGVVFLDAVPICPPELSVEVLTPHGKGSGAPEDAGDPKPIGFLAVKRGTFQFAVFPTHPSRLAPTASRDVSDVLKWVREALAEIGAGAKTKSYGRFEPPT